MENQIIPARKGAARNPLDSAFLHAHARRLETGSKWLTALHVLIGGAIGYGLATAIILVQQFVKGFGAFPLMLAQKPAVVQPDFPLITIILPAIFAIIAGVRGKMKSDEARFRSQMAFHILHLQELALRDKE